MTDFRALCAELAAELDHNRRCLLDDATLTHPLADRARAALTETADGPAVPEGREPAAIAEQPRPAPPAEGEVAELVAWLRENAEYSDYQFEPEDAVMFRRIAELLERHAAPVPVPVSERPWEREGWCDEQGQCWFGREESVDWSADWTLATPEEVEEFCTYAPRTVCLPAHALPLPAPQGGEVEP